MLRRLAIGISAVVLVSPSGGQPHFRLGGEFLVNSYTVDAQTAARVASTGDGGFIVTWQSYGQDGSGAGAFARRFSSAGIAVGVEMQANTHTLGEQLFPATAAAPDGRFVVVWRSFDGDGLGLFGQVFSPANARVGGEFQVNSSTSGHQLDPLPAMDADGNFRVAWVGSGVGVREQRFTSSGDRVGGELQLDSYTGPQYGHALAARPNGDFVLTWASPDGDSSGVFAQRFSSSGTTQGAWFQVNVSTLSSQTYAHPGLEADGDFVVAWTSGGAPHSDIFARRFDSSGDPLGGEFQVNTYTSSVQFSSKVAMGARGEFVIVWSDYFHDGAGLGVFARSFSRDGVAQGAELQINSHTEGGQRMPSASSAGGRTIVAWSSGIVFSDIFAQRLAKPIPLDVDGDGAVGPLTDAVLTQRYSFGFRGATLVTGAVNLFGCTRCDAASIEAYLDEVTQ